MSAVMAEEVLLPAPVKHGVSLSVLRLDKIHPVISGNKWFKLLYHLEAARQQRAGGLLTFGGAYSNHIVAVACAAAEAGLNSTGIIRGEAPARLSPTLEDAGRYGMRLVFAERAFYKSVSDGADEAFIKEAAERYPGYHIIPEGGSGPLGVRGSAAISRLIDASHSHILCAIGTGTMFTGLAGGIESRESGVGSRESKAGTGRQVIGIPVLKSEAGWPAPPAGSIIPGYHFGGYARKTAALLDFMNFFYDHTGIPTDFVYTGKLLFATLDLIEKGYFAPGSRVLAIHSGGLQGNRSLAAGVLRFS